MTVIRVAVAGDAATLTEIESDADQRYAESAHPELAGGSPIPRDVTERAVAQGRVRVALVDETLVGFVLLIRSRGELCIGQISVRPSAGRSGVGSMLMRHVIDEARANGETGIVLNTQADVAWNMPWYERLGFTVVPEEDWTDDMRAISAEQTAGGLDWATRVHMRLALRATAK